MSEQDQAVTATTQTATVASPLTSPSYDLGGYEITGTEPVTSTKIDLRIGAHARWTSLLDTGLTWDGDDVRQGATVDLARTSAIAGGHISVLWTVTGTLYPFGADDGITIGPLPVDLDVISCTPNIAPLVASDYAEVNGNIGLSGLGAASFGITDADAATKDADFQQKTLAATEQAMQLRAGASIDPRLPSYTCSATGDVTLIKTPGLPLTPYVKLALRAQFTVVQQKATASSQFLIAGAQVAQSTLDLTPTPATESRAMPCDRPAGSDVQYALDTVAWKPTTFLVTQQPFLTIGQMDFPTGFFELPPEFSAPIGDPVKHTLPMELAGPGATTDLGPLQANNVLPTVTAGPFSGVEGVPVQLSQQSVSACPITSYVWTFSNGTSSFGPSPLRAFGPHGSFDGQLVVTDSTHLSGTTDLSISIANAPPVADAGPATSGPWGTQIALVGQATDPGGGALTYSWNFGDGTPGVGGATTHHAYAVPGDYVATFTACDDLVCVPATTAVRVRARTTSVAFTGTNTGVYSDQAGLAGSIVDERGQPVVGGTLAFTLAGSPAGSAQTNSAGNAISMQTVNLAAGSYPITATFAGTPFYVGGATAGTFSVSRMASAVTYTGAAAGLANKVVPLSAKLVDALNRPLVGKTIVFQLGAQQVSAVTGATGLATTSLKLAQHNGTYALTTTWTPAAGDATQWTATSAPGTFLIGK